MGEAKVWQWIKKIYRDVYSRRERVYVKKANESKQGYSRFFYYEFF